jgi:nicotinamide mononucleotide transporter
VIGWYFDKHTSAALPWLDAPIVVFSLISTWLVAEKIIENWYFWIVIDLAAAYLYFARDMHLTSLLYLFYTILAFWGLLQWKKNWHEST